MARFVAVRRLKRRIAGWVVEQSPEGAVVATAASVGKRVANCAVVKSEDSAVSAAFVRVPAAYLETSRPSGWPKDLLALVPNEKVCRKLWEEKGVDTLESSEVEMAAASKAEVGKPSLSALKAQMEAMESLWASKEEQEESGSGYSDSEASAPHAEARWQPQAGNQVPKQVVPVGRSGQAADDQGIGRGSIHSRSDAPAHDEHAGERQGQKTCSQPRRLKWWFFLRQRKRGQKTRRLESRVQPHPHAEADRKPPQENRQGVRAGRSDRAWSGSWSGLDVAGLREAAALGQVQGRVQVCDDGRGCVRAVAGRAARHRPGAAGPEPEGEDAIGASARRLDIGMAVDGVARPPGPQRICGSKEEMSVISGYVAALAKLKKQVKEAEQMAGGDEEEGEASSSKKK